MKNALQIAVGIIVAGVILYGAYYIWNDTLANCESQKYEIAIELKNLKKLQSDYVSKNAELEKIIKQQKVELAKQKRATARAILTKEKKELHALFIEQYEKPKKCKTSYNDTDTLVFCVSHKQNAEKQFNKAYYASNKS